MKQVHKLLTVLLMGNLAAFGQSAPATNYMNLGGADVHIGIGFTNASGVYPRYPLSFPNVVGDKISLWNTNSASPNAPHYGLGVQGFRLQLFAPTTSDNIVFGIGNSADFTENVRFTGDGRVGIGTDVPTLAGLVVDKRIGATNAMFGSTTTGVAIESNFPGISLNGYWNNGRKAIASGFVGGVGFNPTNGTLSLYTSPSSASAANAPINAPDRLVILGNGNVGIGTNPTRKLDVNGNTRIVGDGSTSSLEVLGGVKLITGDQGAGKILTSNADGDASWQKAGYGAIAISLPETQSNSFVDVSNGNAANLPTGIEDLDDDGRYSGGEYTVGQTGYYVVNGSLLCHASQTNAFYFFTYQVGIYVNNASRGTSNLGEYRMLQQQIGQLEYVTDYRYPAILHKVIKCNVGDKIRLKLTGNGFNQASNSTLNLAQITIDNAQFTLTKL